MWADGHEESAASTQYIRLPPPGWLLEWTWMGLVPRSVTEGASRMARSRINTAAVILAKAGAKVWDARNAAAVKWADAVGVTARKTEVRRRRWTQEPRRRTGRPQKDPDDLAPVYRQQVQRQRHFAEAAAAGVPIASAKAKWRMRMLAEKTRQPTLDVLVVSITRETAARQFRASARGGAAGGQPSRAAPRKRPRKMAAYFKKRLQAGARPGTQLDAHTMANYTEEMPMAASGKNAETGTENRSMTVDYDDVTILLGDPPRVGRVAGFIWCNHGGYRLPDNMDIEYVEDGQKVVEEVSLTDQSWVRARGVHPAPNTVAVAAHAQLTLQWARTKRLTSAIRQKLEADCMLLAITPIDYWQILSDIGFLSATSMSATYWAATIARMNTAYVAMTGEVHDITEGERKGEGGPGEHTDLELTN